MKTNQELFAVSKLTLAVQGALMVMLAMPLAAYAEDEDVATLTHPTSTVELGATSVSKASAKFGEYNGLDKNNTDLISNFSIRGGDAYNSFEGGSGTHRVEFKGTDLGTTSRELSGNVSDQGKWSIGIGTDELRHNITDSYQTPFNGAMGGNNFSLPASFGVISTAAKPTIPPGSPYSGGAGTTFLTAPGSNILTAAQLASFKTQDVYSDRKNSSFNAKYLIDSNWDVKFDFNHLVQSGAKLMGVAGDQINGVSTTTLNPAGQTPLVIMNPTNYMTDTFNLAMNWAGEKGFMSASYYGSLFHDDYNSVSFDNPFQKTNSTAGTAGTSPNLQDTMSTMPSNAFHQMNLTGGYALAPSTKLVGGLSRGRNTQNDTYSNSGLMATGGLPQNSLNGVVVTTHADFKLINQTTRDLVLSGGLKYNKRDNQTASNSYSFYTINESPLTTTPATAGTSVNAPMSNKKTQIEFAGDYRIDKNQKLLLSYEHEQIKRWCNNAAANNMQGTLNTAYNGPWTYSAATCAQVPDSKENKLAANYKVRVNEDVNVNAGYGYSRRTSEISPSFYNPMQALGGGAGGEGFEVAGFVAFFQASRKEQLLKAGVNWQASEKLSVTLNGRYTDDKYDSAYGVQKGNSWGLNLDSTYSYDDTGSVSAYLTSQNSSRDMTNEQYIAAQLAAAGTTSALSKPAGLNTWTNKLKENDLTLGLGTKKGGLMGGKLELAGDLTYSVGKTGYGTQFNYAAADGNTPANTCSAKYYLTCGDLPDIKNTLVQLKLVGNYKVDKSSRVMLGYVYQHLNSVDYFYNTYQYGSTPSSMLPTNQQAPNYTVSVVAASYIVNF